MADLPLATLQALERRYDGPIPGQHFLTEEREVRRVRGTVSVLETQAAQFLDAAIRCQIEIEELAEDAAARQMAQWQRATTENRLAEARRRLAAHTYNSADALARAAVLRRRLDLPLHPMMTVSQLVMGEMTKAKP